MYVSRNTCIRRGFSRAGDPAQAARDLFEAIYHPDASLAMFFCSTDYDLHTLERELSGRFKDVPLVGCTSAGEITPAGYLSGSITGFALASPDFITVAAPVGDLRRFSILQGHEVVRDLRGQLEQKASDIAPDNTFALLLIDGLCKCEEMVVSSLSAALGDIPLFGGSSGGDLRFRSSYVFHGGQFHTDSAVLVLVRTRLPFKLFTTDHFVSSDTKMVVTEADPVSRIVTEINAEPAGREYARLLGLDENTLSPMIFATHPVVVKVGGRYYTRSIQKLNDDGSLSFFCAIDKGIVLTVAKGTDILDNVRRLFRGINVDVGPPQLVIGCEGVLRTLELEQKQLKGEVGRLLADNNVVGFSSFGEQYQSMHVNQTFTGAAIGIGIAPHSI
ncbi:MAG: FIST C-terminal domain-containing protein [Rhodospirillales bacterium]|nr:FIST C-terminal domain-containing protein [Rhodospirillales bacterium]